MKALGIDLGGKSIKLGIVEEGAVVASSRVPIAANCEYQTVLEGMIDAARSLLADHTDVKNCGIGSPGIIDHANGTVLYANQFKWAGASLRDDMQKALGLKARLTNDARCAALGEAIFGMGRSYTNVLMLTLGTGVGGAYICNKQLNDSNMHESVAGIFGHITAVTEGRECTCGRRGCLEAYVSAIAIEKRAAGLYGRSLEAAEVFAAARQGDSIAIDIVNEFIAALSAGAVSLANALRPQVIIIGGGLAGSADLYIDRINAILRREVYLFEYAPVIVVKAVLADAGIVGAGYYGMVR
jgi:glucokinase